VKNLLIKNAKLRNREEIVDILVSDGKIVSIEKELKLNTDKVFDACGNLVTPTFVDTHLHIDKAYTVSYGRSSKEETLEELEARVAKLKSEAKEQKRIAKLKEEAAMLELKE